MAKVVRPKQRAQRSRPVVLQDIRDAALAAAGRRRMRAAARDLPLLRGLRERFARRAALQGVRVAACLPVTVETALLMVTLKAGGAQVCLGASRPSVTEDDVAAALVVDHGISTFARRDADTETASRHVQALVETRPQLILEEGAEVVGVLHTRRRELLSHVLGSTEETVAGAHRLRALARAGVLGHPVIAVGEARLWRSHDADLGALRAVLEAPLAGRVVVVVGYGDVGQRVARRARAEGAQVVVAEFEPPAALEAALEGFRVLPLREASRRGEVFCVTSDVAHALRAEHFEKMRDGAVVANVGARRSALDGEAPARLTRRRVVVGGGVEAHTLKDGRRLTVLAGGHPLRQEGAGHLPSQARDWACAHQALVAAWLVEHAGALTRDVHAVPQPVVETLASLELRRLGVKHDAPTEEQARELAAWREGT